jgi:ribosomal protein S27AE
MQYLHDENYYDELYDRLTVEDCRRFRGDREEGKTFMSDVVIDVGLEFKKGEHYTQKSETIRTWMARDRAKDDMLARAVEPGGKRCVRCSSSLAIESKDLHSDKNDCERVLFILTCTSCRKPHAFWENGEEWERRPYLCVKCSTAMASDHKRIGNVITTTYSCPSCGYEEIDTLDLDEKSPEEPIDPNFEEDRKKYCLSDKEGGEYISGREKLKRVTAMMKDSEEHKEAYEAVEKIKTLSIVDLERLLGPVVEKSGYVRLEFAKPDTQRGLTIEFTLQDNTPGRSEYESVKPLQKLLQKTLVETNWRLMSDGITYRLGFLTGRLRGYSGKEALIELTKRESDPSAFVKPEKGE